MQCFHKKLGGGDLDGFINVPACGSHQNNISWEKEKKTKKQLYSFSCFLHTLLERTSRRRESKIRTQEKTKEKSRMHACIYIYHCLTSPLISYTTWLPPSLTYALIIKTVPARSPFTVMKCIEKTEKCYGCYFTTTAFLTLLALLYFMHSSTLRKRESCWAFPVVTFILIHCVPSTIFLCYDYLLHIFFIIMLILWL